MSQEATTEEIDPFVKRVVTVNPHDVVIFRITQPISDEYLEQLRTKLETKMGPIPFLVIGPDIDLTVLKRSTGGAMLIA